MVLSYRFRLYASTAQSTALDSMLGAFCDLYNACLQQRIEAYGRRGVTLRFGQQAAELKAVRAVDDRLAGHSFTAEQQVLRRLDKAFSAFFRRIKRGEKPGFPRFKAKTRFDTAEFRVGDGLTIRKSNRLGIVGIPGEIKVKWHRQIPEGAKLGAATVSRQGGHWYVCFQAGVPVSNPVERAFRPVGIDMGLTSLVALSTSETVTTPQYTKNGANALRRAQRTLARRKRGSKRRAKVRQRVARIHAHTANQRRDFSHKLARSLVDRFSHIALEDLNILGLARGMNAKAVHNAGWGQIFQHIAYKAESAGSQVVFVDPRGTSQTCPECGTVRPKLLGERVHRCDCGCTLDRDVAAARVILRRAEFTGPGHGLQAVSQRRAA